MQGCNHYNEHAITDRRADLLRRWSTHGSHSAFVDMSVRLCHIFKSTAVLQRDASICLCDRRTRVALLLRPSGTSHHSFTAMSEPEKQDDSISESIQDPTQFDADQYPQGMKLVAVVLSLILCMFVASMDNVSARISIQIKSKDRG